MKLPSASLLDDRAIAELARRCGMIEPFVDRLVEEGLSYGLSSFGYDARLADEFVLFADRGEVIDPLDPPSDGVRLRTDALVIPPHGFALARTVEYFRIPEDILALCLGKSSYARCGLIVNVTPLEPGWEGEVTLELTNSTPRPLRVHAGRGICQFLFFRGARRPRVTYADRSGKYQGQRGVTLPRAGRAGG